MTTVAFTLFLVKEGFKEQEEDSPKEYVRYRKNHTEVTVYPEIGGVHIEWSKSNNGYRRTSSMVNLGQIIAITRMEKSDYDSAYSILKINLSNGNYLEVDC